MSAEPENTIELETMYEKYLWLRQDSKNNGEQPAEAIANLVGAAAICRHLENIYDLLKAEKRNAPIKKRIHRLP